MKRRDKWQWFYKLFGITLGMFGTVSHDLHRLRRAALNPYFSKQSVTRLTPLIQSRIDALCGRLTEAQITGEPLNLAMAYSALTADIVTKYSFGKSYGFLATPDFGSGFYAIVLRSGLLAHLIKQFGWIYPMLNAMPAWLVALVKPEIMPLIHLRNVCVKNTSQSICGRSCLYNPLSKVASPHHC